MKHIKKYESFSVNEELKFPKFADLATAFKELVSMSAEDIIKKFPAIADVESKVNAVLSNQKLPVDLTAVEDPEKIKAAATQLSSVATNVEAAEGDLKKQSVAGDLEKQSDSKINDSKINENILNTIKSKLKSIWDKVSTPVALVSAAAALAPIFMEMEGFVARGQADTFKFLGFNEHDPGGQSVTGLGFAAMVYAVAALAYYVKKGLVDKQVDAATRKPATGKPVNKQYDARGRRR